MSISTPAEEVDTMSSSKYIVFGGNRITTVEPPNAKFPIGSPFAIKAPTERASTIEPTHVAPIVT